MSTGIYDAGVPKPVVIISCFHHNNSLSKTLISWILSYRLVIVPVHFYTLLCDEPNVFLLIVFVGAA